MKALVLAAALATLSSTALAGAARDAQQAAATDKTTPTLIADAGRLGSASLSSLNGGSHWTPAARQADSEFDSPLPDDIDAGPLLVALGVIALAAARPAARALRRLEQQRRATALASTLGHTHR